MAGSARFAHNGLVSSTETLPQNPTNAARPALKPLALPAEHGAWGFVIEPVLVVACLAPPPVTLALAATALGGFLLRHPLKLACGDLWRGRTYPRTRWALGLAAAYGLATASAAVGLVSVAGSRALLALLLPLPLLAVQFFWDVRQRGRELLPEALGTLAPGALAAGVMLSLGWSAGRAGALWALLALRGLASVVYVRARLRRSRGAPASRAWPWALHALALLVGLSCARLGLGPWLAVAALAVLLLRSLHGLTLARTVRPQAVGFQEMGYGLGSALAIGLGYALGF